MALPHVLTGLVEKRRELHTLIRDTTARLEQQRLDLVHIDGAIRVIDPTFKISTIKTKCLPTDGIQFKPGELGRLVLGVLRTAQEPMTIRQVAVAVLAKKGLETGDDLPPIEIERRVEGAMQKRDGQLLERVPLAGRLWVGGWREEAKQGR